MKKNPDMINISDYINKLLYDSAAKTHLGSNMLKFASLQSCNSIARADSTSCLSSTFHAINGVSNLLYSTYFKNDGLKHQMWRSNQ